jgi:hypothetical protein
MGLSVYGRRKIAAALRKVGLNTAAHYFESCDDNYRNAYIRQIERLGKNPTTFPHFTEVLNVVIAVRLEGHVVVPSVPMKQVKALIAEEQFENAALMLRMMLITGDIVSSSKEFQGLFFRRKKQTSFAAWILEGHLDEQRS